MCDVILIAFTSILEASPVKKLILTSVSLRTLARGPSTYSRTKVYQGGSKEIRVGVYARLRA